jgi:riboflavin synthase alpha subunit
VLFLEYPIDYLLSSLLLEKITSHFGLALLKRSKIDAKRCRLLLCESIARSGFCFTIFDNSKQPCFIVAVPLDIRVVADTFFAVILAHD